MKKIAINWKGKCWAVLFISCVSFKATATIDTVTNRKFFFYPFKMKHSTPDQVLQVYPNPAQNELNIMLELDQHEGFRTEIYNLNGLLVKSEKLDPNPVKIQQLPAGLYWLVLRREQEVYVRKFMISR